MTTMRMLGIAIGLCFSAAAANAQGTRVSSFEPNSSMTFHQYLEPFPRTPTAEACRDDCVADSRCTGWTWYEPIESNPQPLRGVCIKGAGLKDRRIGDARGRSAGEIRNQ
jgi:hypothetical protein